MPLHGGDPVARLAPLVDKSKTIMKVVWQIFLEESKFIKGGEAHGDWADHV